MKQTSFWEKDSFYQPYDLIVVGAGIVGLSSALFYKLQHQEANILVIDKGSLPEGASTRNAGFACTGSITEHMADMEKETEENIKKRIKRRFDGLQLLRKTLGDAAIDYENCGGYELFTDPKSFEQAEANITLFNEWLQELTGEKKVYQSQKLNGYDVIYNRLEGAIHPGKMMHALIARVQSAGIPIYWKTPVAEIDDSGSVLLNEGDDVLKTRQVLVASNGFTRHLLKDIPIEPARGVVMVSEPWAGLPWQGTFHYDRGYVYFRNVGDRLLLGGGRNIAEDRETTNQFDINPAVKEYLQNFARDILKMPPELNFKYEWSGIMGFSPTKTPIVKQLDEHRFVAAGLSGMGIAIGMEVGQTAADLLNSQD